MKNDFTRLFRQALSLLVVLMIFIQPFKVDAGPATAKPRNTADMSKDRTITGKVSMKEDGSGTVSYTHLDVYKRQAYRTPGFHCTSG